MNLPQQPRPDDAVLGSQSLAPIDGAVLGGIEGVKQRFEVGDFEQKKQALDQALQYGDRGIEFLVVVSEGKFPAEVKGYAKRLRVLEILKQPGPANLTGIDLTGTDLSRVNLSRANLKRTIINSETQINPKWRLVWEIINQGANGRDLRGANLSGADLSRADLREANLSGASLWGLTGPNPWRLTGSGPNLWRLRGANLHEANLRGADLSGANLRGINLHNANLHEANLRSSDFGRGDEDYLGTANLQGADLRGADLRGCLKRSKYGVRVHLG